VKTAFEATAPCRVDLASGPDAVCVAVDRRAWCRVETGVLGVAVESKDTLQRVTAPRAPELGGGATAPVALVREALRAFAVDTGIRVVTQVKVPSSSGLGGETALAVALVGALSHACGRDLGRGDVAARAAEVVAAALGSPADPADVAVAVHGGCVAAAPGRAAVRLDVDPAAIEECLMLVEAGPDGEPAVGTIADREGHGARVRAALLGRRLEDLAGALAEDWDARARVPGWAGPERRRVGEALRPAGAGLRVCGGGRGTVVVVVAPPGPRGPGPREAVAAAAKAASLRLFPARADLLGLDVEKAG
jgi:hypothetical protein